VEVLGDQVRAGARRTVAAAGSSARRSMSERGASSRRPYPPVATSESGTGSGPGKPRCDRAEHLADHLVRERGDAADDFLPSGPGPMTLEDLLAASRKPGPHLRHRGVVPHLST